MHIFAHRISPLRCLIALSLFSFLHVGTPVHAATPAEVDAAIKKAVDWLYTQQHNGNWEMDAARVGEAHDWPKMQGSEWGGNSAMATYALLAAGESPQKPAMKQGIAFNLTADIVGVYAVGMRAQIWPYLPADKDKAVKAAVMQDANFLKLAMKTTPDDAYGMFHYTIKDPGYDHSTAQYGVLGAWACQQANPESIPGAFWTVSDAVWKKHQNEDGGWSYLYKPKDVSSPSMALAGVATLFITQDYLHGAEAVACKGNITNKNIEKGLGWLDKNFSTCLVNSLGAYNNLYYTLYGVERVGVASGRKYFGKRDWYAEGANVLVTTQKPDGSWVSEAPNSAVANTAFAVLFLARGRAPVSINKLEYTLDTAGDKAKESHWNQRPRDAANISRWIGKGLERDLNWQIVNLNVNADALHDAPILYIAGDQDLLFSQADMDALKHFVEGGGMIMGNADCNTQAFVKSFQKLGTKLFPKYPFRELPANHQIFIEEQFRPTDWKNPPTIVSQSNGSRELMLLFEKGDPSKGWQMQTTHANAAIHELMANVFLYAVDKKNLRFKGETYIVNRDASVATTTIKLARIQYDGNWDPEPGGWRRLANILHNLDHTDLVIEPVTLGDHKLAAYKVAHVTGNAALKLSEAAQSELREFVQKGGTLIVDALAGSTEFGSAADDLLRKLFPDAAVQLDAAIPSADAFYTNAGINAGDIEYRAFATKVLGRQKSARLKRMTIAGRAAVYYSSDDLSTGLVGQPVDGIIGYTPESATALMRGILLATLPPKPTTKPTSTTAPTTRP